MRYWLLRAIPKNHLSLLVGRLVHTRLPRPLDTLSVRIFCRLFSIDPDTAEHPLSSYRSIGEFFTRRLRPGARPMGTGLVSPVDGTLRSSAAVQEGHLEQVKGQRYSLRDLLHHEDWVARLQGGQAFNLYLSPRDYHRVHSPIDGQIAGYMHVPGALWPVNDWALTNISKLFCVNERIAIGIETRFGLVVLVMVAATNVGCMSLSFATLRTNCPPLRGRSLEPRFHALDPARSVARGDELGVFHMGSSVVLLTERNVRLSPINAPQPRSVRWGETLAELAAE